VTVSGIDVASYQSSAYSTTGLGFVMVKATEGTGYVNPRHAAQVATGRRHALVVGHYHFVKPGPSMAAQADYFLQHAAAAPGDVLALDWEDTGVTGEEKDAWIRHVQAAAPGHRVVLYCNRDFWVNRDHTSFAGDGLWIADPGAPAGHPRIEHDWLIHQYSEAGGLDHDVANFASTEAMRAWAAKSAPTPEENDKAGMTSAEIYDAVWRTDRLTPPAGLATKTNPTWTAENALRDIDTRLRALQSGESAQSAAIAALARLAGKNVDTAAVVAAVQQAVADAVVKVDVSVSGTPAKG
jgi:hypothetical protein